ncbi:hypothetical protein K439DRAFT_1615806 [Ramaria rubella]|nr:hypothetical protein K439DRAFT_1615806 [Ramaria rubella]
MDDDHDGILNNKDTLLDTLLDSDLDDEMIPMISPTHVTVELGQVAALVMHAILVYATPRYGKMPCHTSTLSAMKLEVASGVDNGGASLQPCITNAIALNNINAQLTSLNDFVQQICLLELKRSPEGRTSTARKILQAEHNLTATEKLALCEDLTWNPTTATVFCDMEWEVCKLWIPKQLMEVGFRSM